MTKWIVGNACAAVTLSFTLVSAQAPNQQPQPAQTDVQQGQTRSDTAPAASAQRETITLHGCIANATGGAGSVTAAPGGVSASAGRTDQFTLTEMPATGAASSSAVGTSGRPAMKYNLTGSTNLSQYVGKRVEVTGTKVDARGIAGSGASSSAAGAISAPPQDFRVASVRVVEGDCQ